MGLAYPRDESVPVATPNPILELLKEMSKNSAEDNDRPNRRGEALPWTDFQTMVTYGYDQKRPKEEGWIDYITYLVLKFITTTAPVV